MTDYVNPINISNMIFALMLKVKTKNGTIYINSDNQFEHGLNVTLHQTYQKLVNG